MLERILPPARLLAAAALRLTIAAFVSAAVLLGALLRSGLPDVGRPVAAIVVLASILFAPAAVLVFVWRALAEVVSIPDRLRVLPGAAGDHVNELVRLAHSSGRPVWHDLPSRAWRLLRLAGAARETLTPYAPLVVFLSPAFLLVAALAAVAALAEAIAAFGVIVVLAGTA